MKYAISIVTSFLIGIALIAVGSLLTGLIVWMIWNAIIPVIFGLPTLTYFQAFLLTWLCSCLFKTISSSKD